MEFEVTPLAPLIGSMVTGLDLSRDMSDATMRRLIDLLFDRGVIVIKGQDFALGDYVRFARFFGNPLVHIMPEFRVGGFPEVTTIHNDPATPPAMRDGAVHWHSDSSYEAVPGAVTMLYGKESPAEGGETWLASTAAAYADLPDAMKERLEGLVARHELGAAPWIEGENEPDPGRPRLKTDAPRHPLIMQHPVTGRKAIFTSGTAHAIEGMDQAEATALIRTLREAVVKPEYRVTYKVMPGDIVLWDNFSTVHSATPIEYSAAEGHRRLLYRISTKGVPDLCTAPR